MLTLIPELRDNDDKYQHVFVSIIFGIFVGIIHHYRVKLKLKMEKPSITDAANSDRNIIEQIGGFIRDARLSQNKTQQELATAAGINRTTLSQLEKGESVNLLSLIQVLRSLKRLDVLKLMEPKLEISPLKLAELEQKQRQRASKKSDRPEPQKSDW